MIDILSYGLIVVGVFFWFWGIFFLVGYRLVLYKFYSLLVVDILGLISIVVGLFLKIFREWFLLLLVIIILVIWNIFLGYILVYCFSVDIDIES